MTSAGILAVIERDLHQAFGHAKRNDVRDLASAVIIKDDVTGFPIGEQQVDHVPLGRSPRASRVPDSQP